MKLRRIATTFALLAIVGNVLACGGMRNAAQRATDSNELKMIGLAWHSHNEALRKGPSKAEDLFPYMEGAGSASSMALKSGKYVLYYDVSLNDISRAKDSPGTSKTVLGYASGVPSSGGLVLMADGMVQQMTAAEFNAAPKASQFKGSGKQAAPGPANPLQRAKDTNELKQIGLAWHSHNDTLGKGPSKAEDLFPYLEGAASTPSQALKSGKFVFAYDIGLTDVLRAGVGTSNTVLAYEANAPAFGGLVLMADGSVRRMTAAEFAGAKKASELKKK